MAVGYSALWLNGKTLMWRMDEAGQSYVAFAYMGQWLRQWARQILTGGGVMPPLFELSLGMGADVIQTLNYVGFGNPILALFSLLPSAWWAAAFTAAVLAQVYLAGLAFSWYAFEWKVSTGQALTGSLCYAFCGHALVYQTVFSPYLAPVLYLPVMLLGFERAFRGKSAWPLVLATVYGGLCGYYTLFMCTAFLVPYGLARGWYIHGLKGWKRTADPAFGRVCGTVRCLRAGYAGRGDPAGVQRRLVRFGLPEYRLAIELVLWQPGVGHGTELPGLEAGAGPVRHAPELLRHAWHGSGALPHLHRISEERGQFL